MNELEELQISHLESDLSLRYQPDFYSLYPGENLTATESHESNYFFWFCEIIGKTQESSWLGCLC